LDHCGALPYFTEMCGYDGPIYMTVRDHTLPLVIYLFIYFRLKLCALTTLFLPLASYQGHLPHFAGGLPQDHRGTKGRPKLFHVADDKRMHEERCTFSLSLSTQKENFHIDSKLHLSLVIAVNVHQTVQVDDELEIRAYYAGHVSV
jgi:Cft2 family RNA processing exonuclease